MRLSLVAAAVGFSLMGLSTAQEARAALRKPTDIPAQQLEQALQALAQERDFQVIYRSEIVGQRQSGGATGNLTEVEALDRLLHETGLTYRYLDDHTVTILPLPASEKVNSEAQGTSVSALEEIVVTAQKRNERLQDVPVPVTAIQADSLVNSNQTRLQDYYTRIPGLSMGAATSQPQGGPLLAIRGVTTGGDSNPTVGVTIDDVPYGSSTALGWGYVIPEIDPNELARVEVLRGPQGTLYGASSIGGLLKFVTTDPSTDRLSGDVQAGLNHVQDAEDPGFSVRGSLNLPLGETLALRASAFTRRDAGYIDNVQTGESDVNEIDTQGGRVSALWKVSESTSLKLSALIQDTAGDGAPYVNVAPGVGDLEQNALRESGAYEIESRFFSAILTSKIATFDITSVSGYGERELSSSADVPIFAGVTEPTFGVRGTLFTNENESTKFSQEVRAQTSTGRLDWLFGLFFTHEKNDPEQQILAVDSDTLSVAGQWVYNSLPTTFSEYAAFADVTIHVSDRFDIQVGGRESRTRQVYSQMQSGPLAGPVPLVNPKVHTSESAFTYLVTPRFKVSPDLMVYARLASGYRAGGPNLLSTVFDLPASYEPDKTKNYEIGIKGTLLERVISFDTSVYYIDWKDIQLSSLQRGNTYFVNASRAASQGVELSVEARPTDGLTIAAWAAWNDAELSEDFPEGRALVGNSADRLPYSSRFSANLAIDQSFPLGSRLSGFVGASVSYVGDRKGLFQATPTRQDFPSYTKADLRAGISYESWAFDFYVNNVADQRGVLGGGLDLPFFISAFNYIQPRTIGASLRKSF